MFDAYLFQRIVHLQASPDGVHNLIVDAARVHAEDTERFVDAQVLWEQLDESIEVGDFLRGWTELEGELIQVQVGEGQFLVVPEGR